MELAERDLCDNIMWADSAGGRGDPFRSGASTGDRDGRSATAERRGQGTQCNHTAFHLCKYKKNDGEKKRQN